MCSSLPVRRLGVQVRGTLGHRTARTRGAGPRKAGAPRVRVVQEILGHTRVTTTERYTHVASLQMKDASDRMDAALWGQE